MLQYFTIIILEWSWIDPILSGIFSTKSPDPLVVVVVAVFAISRVKISVLNVTSNLLVMLSYCFSQSENVSKKNYRKIFEKYLPEYICNGNSISR